MVERAPGQSRQETIIEAGCCWSRRWRELSWTSELSYMSCLSYFELLPTTDNASSNQSIAIPQCPTVPCSLDHLATQAGQVAYVYS